MLVRFLRHISAFSQKNNLVLKNSVKWKLMPTRLLSSSPTITQTKSDDRDKLPHYMGIRSKFTTDMTFPDYETQEGIPVYRIMAHDGSLIDPSQDPNLDKTMVTKMYKDMTLLNVMDQILYDSQRQGRISFYMTNYGEEGTQVGSAAALNDQDLMFAQYREAGCFVWRGYTLDEFMDQCYGNSGDANKGRQMPVHYGSKRINVVTISSPLATQLPQAAGAAYSYARAKKGLCVACYFGEGSASEGDAHGAFNFAATLNCPVVFICRNNGFAISTPAREQYKGDGIASRGVGYGMTAIRVDGNDTFAVYNATKKAREISISQSKPVLIEAMTYRVGDHSTSDDSSAYRPKEEVKIIATEDSPITRLRLYMEAKNWWSEEEEKEWRTEARKQIITSFAKAEKKKKASPTEMFRDVYHEMPTHLNKQLDEMKMHVEKYKDKYPLSDFNKIL